MITRGFAVPGRVAAHDRAPQSSKPAVLTRHPTVDARRAKAGRPERTHR